MPFRFSLAVVASAAALAACSPQPDTKTAPPVDSTHVGEGTAAGDVAGTFTADETLATVGGGDTTHLRLKAGRNAHDSLSYLIAVRRGARMLEKWPAAPAPLAGSIMPTKRIVAFYGNPLVKKMGVLGEYPVDEMLAKLDQTVTEWRKADPSTPVQPALHLIAVVAQGAPGRDGMYRLRMDTALIEKVYGWAQRKNALLFLDVQVGHSTLQQELPRLLPFLARPNVHLAVDPEFSMHYEREGLKPSTKVGQMDAADVNYASQTLAKLVSEKHLPPKVLVVHRWTKKMVSHASSIKLDPRVQIVMDMDGWGPPWLKFDSYRDYVVAEPVEYTGFKLFFHHDVKKGDALLTPTEVLRLLPKPMYIQYQ
jgi:hypothetical protein